MESTPKKATEKIGGELRKKLPKKSVGLADCENGLLYGDRMAESRTAKLAVRLIGRLTDWQIQAVEDLPKLVTFWLLGI